MRTGSRRAFVVTMQKKPIFFITAGCIVAAGVVLTVAWRGEKGTANAEWADRRAPVAVAPIERGSITLRRTFSGTLEAYSSFNVASEVSGRIESIAIDIGDPVERNQVVATLEDAEFEQAVAQADADLAVAQANLVEARSLAEISDREIQRMDDLRVEGFTSQSQLDTVEAESLARQARLKVAEAQITRSQSALKSARIRLGYSTVVAGWDGPGDERVVAERFFDEGDTVSANSPILRVVDIDRMIAVIFVTERDYASLHDNQEATFVTDAFPGETFAGSIKRIAPVFREATRQARVELLVPNPGRRLKPGMFVRAMLTLDHVDDTTIVPEAAITRRGDAEGVRSAPGNAPTLRPAVRRARAGTPRCKGRCCGRRRSAAGRHKRRPAPPG
jgi:RND family efflux transporter MFP subunit